MGMYVWSSACTWACEHAMSVFVPRESACAQVPAHGHMYV